MIIRAVRPSWSGLQARGVPLLLRALAWLPSPMVEGILGLVGLTQAFLEPSRARRAFAWAASQPETGKGKWRLALSLLFNRGRLLAIVASPARMTPESFLRRVVLEGVPHLEAARKQGGTILLGFHLGPNVAGMAFRAHGYTFTATGEGWNFKGWPRARTEWRSIPRRDGHVLWPGPDPAVRGAGLYRVRRALLAGRTVRITADGRSGREAFRIAVPGGEVVIRAGWWILRRQTGATTLPVLAHRQGPKVVVTVHAALPAPTPDPLQDLAACRDALSGLLQEYVRRFPEQCVSLALWSLKNEGSR